MIIKINSILILLFIIGTNLLSQRTDLMLIPFEMNGLWGYMNTKKEIIVKPLFEEAFLTFNLVGRIKKNGKYGYINNIGKLIVKPKYDNAEDFDMGIAKVYKGNKSYYINTSGKKNKTLHTGCGFHYHVDLPIIVKDSLFITKRYTAQQVKVLNLIIPSVDSIYDISAFYFVAKKNNKFAIIEEIPVYLSLDSIINSIHYKYDSIKYFACSYEDGAIKNHVGINKSGYWGYFGFNVWSTQIIEPKYSSIETFNGEFAKVEFEPKRFGYIDIYGNEYFYRSR